MATREEVQKEVEAINKLIKTTKGIADSCDACNGKGVRYYPVFGDPKLGYTAERCMYCNGTGVRLRFKK